MAGALQIASISTTLRVEVNCSNSGSNYGNPDDFIPRKSQSHHNNRLSISKPVFIIRSESNVRKMRRRKPEPSCAVCEGSGRVDCHHCHGKGRTNLTELMMLPKGEWPKWLVLSITSNYHVVCWCKTCGGSGLAYCNRCLGTGEYRDIMGFHFMKREGGVSGKPIKSQNDDKPEHLTGADLLFSQSSSETEFY